jgi:hypothetical protein
LPVIVVSPPPVVILPIVLFPGAFTDVAVIAPVSRFPVLLKFLLAMISRPVIFNVAAIAPPAVIFDVLVMFDEVTLLVTNDPPTVVFPRNVEVEDTLSVVALNVVALSAILYYYNNFNIDIDLHPSTEVPVLMNCY